VFSPENMSAISNILPSDTARNSDISPAETFQISNLDSSVDECMDQTAPW